MSLQVKFHSEVLSVITIISINYSILIPDIISKSFTPYFVEMSRQQQQLDGKIIDETVSCTKQSNRGDDSTRHGFNIRRE